MTVTAPSGGGFFVYGSGRGRVPAAAFLCRLFHAGQLIFQFGLFFLHIFHLLLIRRDFFRVALLPDQTDAAEKQEEIIKFFRVAEHGTTAEAPRQPQGHRGGWFWKISF